jgi:hypothetical protein
MPSDVSDRDLDATGSYRTGLELTEAEKMPSRIMVNLEGVEMFVFNRTPAYDNIVERMKKHERQEAAAAGKQRGSDGSASPAKENPITLRLRKVYKAATAGKGGDEERLEAVKSHDSTCASSVIQK